jgi:hypothetical protein
MNGSSGSQGSWAAVARAAAMIKLRTARPADAPELAGLLAELGYPQAAAELAPRIAALADIATDTVLVAEVGGQVVGLASLHVTPFFNEGQAAAASPRWSWPQVTAGAASAASACGS